MRKRIITIALSLLLLMAIFASGVYAAGGTQFWAGTIPTTITEALVVKSGTTVLPDGYVFTVVNLKTGEKNVKTITVTNTATIGTWLVKPNAMSPYPDYVTAVWTTNGGGILIAPGGSADFVLEITAFKPTPSVTIAINFTKE